VQFFGDGHDAPPTVRCDKSRPALRLTTGRVGALGTTKKNPSGIGFPAGLWCSDAEVTYSSLPRAGPCLHANDPSVVTIPDSGTSNVRADQPRLA
jgi:hypothetical protein